MLPSALAEQPSPHQPPAPAIRVSAHSDPQHRHFVAVFFALVVLQLCLAIFLSAGLRGVGNYDSAYYYVVARNFALGRGLTDTVRWHFLDASPVLVRPAGDYWPWGWPLVLGSLLRLFGSSQRAALWVCAALSALVPALTFWLAFRLWGRVRTALFAGLLICLSGVYVDLVTDVTLSYRIACLIGLLGFVGVSRTPVKMLRAGALLALPFYLRGEGFLLLGAASLALLLEQMDALRQRRVSRWAALAGWLLLGGALCLVPLLTYNLVRFGHLTPPARGLAVWMTSYGQLNTFAEHPSPQGFLQDGVGAVSRSRLGFMAYHLKKLLHLVSPVLLATAAAGLLLAFRTRRSAVLPLVFFLGLSFLLPCLLAPVVATPARLANNTCPVLCVLAALAIGWISSIGDSIARQRTGGGGHRLSALLLAAGVFFCCVRRDLPALALRQSYWSFYLEQFTTPAEPLVQSLGRPELDLGQHRPVLTSWAWRVAADLDVPTIAYPFDGARPGVLAKVLSTYRPRYVLVHDDTPLSVVRNGALWATLPLRQRLRVQGATWYEVVTPESSPQ